MNQLMLLAVSRSSVARAISALPPPSTELLGARDRAAQTTDAYAYSNVTIRICRTNG